jgi:hypothetical protein
VTSLEPPAEVWVSDALEVRASEIEGRGLFAIQPVPAETALMRLGGRLVTTRELGELIAAAVADPALPYVDTFSVSGDLQLVLPPGTAAHFANHSCDPNAWHQGPYDIVARRSVAVGEEVTLDYATFSGAAGFSMRCHCVTASCREVISSDDWRDPALQRVYRGHWVPAIQERIDSL